MKLDHCHRAGCVQIIEQLQAKVAEFDWAVYCEMLWQAIKESEAK